MQLWACQAPFTGGYLSGWKLAELKLVTLDANHIFSPVKSDMPCQIPDNGDNAMVLVIGEWNGDDYNAVHDFHNYPNRDFFLNPRLEGLVKYRFMGDGRLMVGVERIHNPRDSGNTSGTLTLEFWAHSVPYVAGDFYGSALGGVTLGTLSGSETWQDDRYYLQYSLPPPGTSTLVTMLREWAGSGYVTRDIPISTSK